MYYLMLRDLENVDVSNIGQLKRILAKIENDIRYWRRLNNLSQIQKIMDTLDHYLSTNSNKTYIVSEDKIPCYLYKRYFSEIMRLRDRCQQTLDPK